MFNFLFGNNQRWLSQDDVREARRQEREHKLQLKRVAAYVKATGNKTILKAKIDALWQAIGIAEAEAEGVKQGIAAILPEARESARRRGASRIKAYSRNLLSRAKETK